jgi:Flp pilus assembly protein TadD
LHARQRAQIAEQEQARLRKQAEERAEMGQKMGMAGLYLTQDRFEDAEKVMNDVPPYPSSAGIFNALGMIHGHRGEWSASARNLAKVVALAPSDHLAYHYLAPLLVETNDIDGYRTHCQQILKHFADTTDPTVAERMAKDCLMIPPLAADLDAIRKMADTAAAAGSNHKLWRYFQFVKGLSEYRQGHYQNAVDWLQEVVAEQGYPHRRVQAHMVLAMAQHRLGQTEQARDSLANGIAIADAKLPKIEKGNLGGEWNDWIIAHVLIREAKAMIAPVTP